MDTTGGTSSLAVNYLTGGLSLYIYTHTHSSGNTLRQSSLQKESLTRKRIRVFEACVCVRVCLSLISLKMLFLFRFILCCFVFSSLC